ncbi:Type I restriction endonuclease subunit S [Lactococcus piscium]|nr:restriction endonuclease subunit S [Lactococcus carnosus]SOB47924.1 Type I restriction endonuclease subunit S [Lactococcus piscium]
MQKNIRILPFYSYFLLIIAWEQRQLGEVSESYSGGTPSANKSEYYGGDIPFIRSAEINSNNTELFITEDGLKSSSSRMVKTGEILYALYGATSGEVGISKINGAINQAILAIKPKFGYNSQFIMQLLRFKKQRITERYLQGGQGNLSGSIVKELEILFPFTAEQSKIGTFFKQLDDTITLHQRKLDKLKLLKQGYLQQFFPQYDEKIPKVRFANFTDEWEQRNVGNFLSESKVKGSDGSIAKKITVKLWRKGIVPKNNMFKGSSATQYYIRSAGQFMYGKLDFLNQSFGILPAELNGYESTLDSPAFDFKNGIDPIFFLENVCQENFYKYQGNIANGSRKAKRIHSDTFFDMPIIIPNFEEQQKVGSFFKELDTTIALHQSKLGKLKSLKQVLASATMILLISSEIVLYFISDTSTDASAF